MDLEVDASRSGLKRSTPQFPCHHETTLSHHNEAAGIASHGLLQPQPCSRQAFRL